MSARTAACLILAMTIQQPAPRENAVVIDPLILGTTISSAALPTSSA